MYERGKITMDLAASLPKVANWQQSTLPKFLEPEQVERLINACNRATPAGRRDYAVLLLLARLGLRAGEVAHLELDDIDWENGELMVKGKSVRNDRLPIPKDVGEALAGYLKVISDGGVVICLSQVFITLRLLDSSTLAAAAGIDPALVFQHAHGRRSLVRGEQLALEQLQE